MMRQILLAALTAPFLLSVARAEPIPDSAFKALEEQGGGRLGVAVLDTETGDTSFWRGDERFAMASSFKAPLCGAVLARVDAGDEQLDRPIPISADDLIPYAPTVEKHIGGSLTVAQLCEATITLSDNVAANLLLDTLGGPSGLTAFLRSIGDDVTRLDRFEPELNEATLGDPRDTTTPRAMADTLNSLLLGGVLSVESRTQLADWLKANQTGDDRIRAGLPEGWQIGDKTGTSGTGTFADIAILYPPQGKPILMAVYLAETDVSTKEANGVHAGVAQLVADWVESSAR
ncbi:class A beta-lactamase [Cereibacter changlensis]|uniref:beta-lactamase n=2 Tax=Cereibacter changlensis TaxID=402884 RepID=A0A4U0Z3Q0_9RHOB|nr:class A beta-lactamase [Cereibacter changlensis]TKA97071.1 class A beta-lactamase [Cereibacter changlensis]